MLLPTKNDKNKNKKIRFKHNIFINNKLPTSLILSVLATRNTFPK